MTEYNFDCEVRDENTSFKHHVIAGSLAGIQEHICMLPFDNIKTHSQVMDGQSNKYTQIIKSIYNRGGIKEFYRGSSFVALGCGPAHAAYFSVYEFAKVRLEIQNEDLNPVLFFLVGCSATLFHDFIMTPCDVLKQRSQLLSGHTKNINFMQDIVNKEGIRSLYRSLPITMMMNIPWQGTLVATNETLKRLYKTDEQHTFFSYFLCAGIASSIASTLTIPLDNIRTRLQTQCCYLNEQWFLNSFNKQQLQQQNKQTESSFQKVKNIFKLNINPSYQQSQQKNYNQQCSNQLELNGCDKYQIKYKNIKQTIQLIYVEEGLRGFTKGIGPRVLSTTPASAIQWATYETIKRLLVGKNSPTTH